MIRSTVLAAAISACLMYTSDVQAQMGAARDKVDEVAREARDTVETRRADRGSRGKVEKEFEDRRIADSDDDSDSESEDDSDSVSDDDSDSESEDDDTSVRRNFDREAERVSAERVTGQENAAMRGNERSREVRARNDERKAIKDDYSETREAGAAERRADRAGADDVELADDDTAKKGKKPWWKFWGD